MGRLAYGYESLILAKMAEYMSYLLSFVPVASFMISCDMLRSGCLEMLTADSDTASRVVATG